MVIVYDYDVRCMQDVITDSPKGTLMTEIDNLTRYSNYYTDSI